MVRGSIPLGGFLRISKGGDQGIIQVLQAAASSYRQLAAESKCRIRAKLMSKAAFGA